MSQAEYDDILCFIKVDSTMIEVKSLKLFLDQYKTSGKESDKEVYEFLHKYLTLVNSEIFFTDKLIICEGTTERILLPIFIKLCDERKITTKTLRSQKYSIIETGAYSQNLKPLLDLLAIKTLIITYIDFIKGNREKCKCEDATGTSNSSLNTFLNNPSIEKLKDQKDMYVVGNIGITFQHEQNGYHARSFEDAYISINYDYLKAKFGLFKSLKCYDDFMSGDFYLIGDKCIESKSTFATEIAYYYDENFKNINIPSYIEDGLKWISD
jgi:predicted ATP-dependent endonuclease of OLD family